MHAQSAAMEKGNTEKRQYNPLYDDGGCESRANQTRWKALVDYLGNRDRQIRLTMSDTLLLVQDFK